MYSILLNTIENVKSFVNLSSHIEGDIFLRSGRYVVDGKSIMGIFSLDLTLPIELTFDIKNEETIKEYIDSIKDFLVTEGGDTE